MTMTSREMTSTTQIGYAAMKPRFTTALSAARTTPVTRAQVWPTATPYPTTTSTAPKMSSVQPHVV